ncbi:DUF262 domain-containing protein [Stenotrophomonas maltophilia]|nr:DUF262 domain-containing protein [Stenotrophomonas maltophilia]
MTEKVLIEQDLIEEDSAEPASQPSASDTEIEQLYSTSSFRVIYQSNNFLLPQIQMLIEGREIINLRPEYQRRLRWTVKQKSLLIESLLLNVPIPPVFLYESELARYEVMDGQQRLSTVSEYLSNEFPLSGLENLRFLRGKRYRELPPRIRRGLARASISAIVLLHESQSQDGDPSAVRRYVFQRLNTGGKALNPQEIRNSFYSGPFNDLIVKLTRIPDFCDAFGIPRYTETDENEYYENPSRKANNLYKRMDDCQLVLRFFAFLNPENIRGSVRSILDNTMERHASSSQDELTALSEKFKSALAAATAIFGDDIFTLPPNSNGVRRTSAALYDAVMVSLANRSAHYQQLIDRREDVRSAIDQLSTDNSALITGRANTAASITGRITAVGQVLDSVLP